MEIRLWRELLIPYELAVKELVMKFNHLKKEHQEKDLYSPIEEVTGRVKSINSILEKMQRKKHILGGTGRKGRRHRRSKDHLPVLRRY